MIVGNAVLQYLLVACGERIVKCGLLKKDKQPFTKVLNIYILVRITMLSKIYVQNNTDYRIYGPIYHQYSLCFKENINKKIVIVLIILKLDSELLCLKVVV